MKLLKSRSRKTTPVSKRNLLFLIVFLYFLISLVETNRNAVFNGDNAAHIVQANYFKQHPDQIFGWSDIGYAGYPLLFFYQPLPHIILSLFFFIGNIFAVYRVVLIFLFCLIPLSLFYSLRKIGFSEEICLTATIIPLMITSFSGLGFETSAFFGWGLFTELMGASLFPFVISSLFVYIKGDKKRKISSPVFLLSVLFLINPILGVLAVMSSIIILISDLSNMRKRFIDILIIATITFLVISFWLIPLLEYRQFISPIEPLPIAQQSYGLRALSDFVSGSYLDSSRYLPALTILSLFGIAILFSKIFEFKDRFRLMVKKDTEKERFVLFGFFFSFLFFSARMSLKDIPILSFFELHRALFLMHFFILLAVAVAVGTLLERFGKKAMYLIAITLILLSLTSFFQSWSRQKLVNEENSIERVKEISLFLKDMPYGRILTSLPEYGPGYALMYYYSGKPVLEGFSIGAHASSADYSLKGFDIFDMKKLEEYNVKYLIVNSGSFSYPQKKFRDYSLYFINTSGYFFVDKECGNITGEHIEDEVYSADVSLVKDCSVLFKMSYFSLWKAYSEKGLKISRSADSLMLVEADKGTKKITMRYEDVWYRKYLFVLGVAVMIGLFVFENKKLY